MSFTPYTFSRHNFQANLCQCNFNIYFDELVLEIQDLLQKLQGFQQQTKTQETSAPLQEGREGSLVTPKPGYVGDTVPVASNHLDRASLAHSLPSTCLVLHVCRSPPQDRLLVLL